MFSKILWCFALIISAWLLGLGWFVAQIPTQATDDDEDTAAIVVLTGGAGRLEYGLELLAAGRGEQLFISGVGPGTTLDDVLKKTSPDARQIIRNMPYNAVVLGPVAVNTIGNAEETAAWITKHKFKSLRLVTSNYHMPRSLNELHQAMPDVTIIADPVFPDDFKVAGWWSDEHSRTLVLSEYHKYLASVLRLWLISTKHGS